MVKVSYIPPPEQKKKGGKLKKIAKSRIFWLSIVLFVVGAVIAGSFYAQAGPSPIPTSSTKHFVVSDAVAETYQFTLKANNSAHFTFHMPDNETVHYYVSEQIGVYGLPHSKFGGNVVNNSVVNISTYVNTSAITNDTFFILTINSYAPQSFDLTVTLVQEKLIQVSPNNNMINLGALISIAGIILAPVSVSKALKR